MLPPRHMSQSTASWVSSTVDLHEHTLALTVSVALACLHTDCALPHTWLNLVAYFHSIKAFARSLFFVRDDTHISSVLVIALRNNSNNNIHVLLVAVSCSISLRQIFPFLVLSSDYLLVHVIQRINNCF
jgi:hypothetical protein